MKNQRPLLIVGAGMTGLSLAMLIENGFRYGKHRQILFEIVDKGRSVGGRMATRRLDEATFDHGALELSAIDAKNWPAELEKLLLDFQGWNFNANGSRNPSGGMTQWIKWMANQLETKVQLEQKVERLDQERLTVLTCPWPQSQQILLNSKIEIPGALQKTLDLIHYDPCLVGLFAASGDPNTEFDLSKAPLKTVISEQQARKVSKVLAYTVQMGPEWSRERFERDDDSNLKDIQNLFEAIRVEKPNAPEFKIQTSQLKKWRYSRPQTPVATPLAVRISDTVIAAGDGFAGPNLRDAAASAVAAYRMIVEGLNQEFRQ